MRNNVRALRESLNLTQEGLAEALEVSRQTVISIETGRYNPSLNLAFKIADKFSTTIEEVFLRDNHAHAEQ